MRTPAEEPEFGPWRPEPIVTVVDRLLRGGYRSIVAVDGRSAGGKTTVAEALRSAAVDRGLTAVVVHTDDIAWHHSFFDWADLLADGVLEPLRHGEDVAYTPPGWAPHGRAGSLDVPASTDLVLVEGVGAGRRELADLLDAVVWVASDLDDARRRGLDRDVASGVNGDLAQATAFWDEWEAQELPFQADQRPWERAVLVLAGTPTVPLGPGEIAQSSTWRQ